VEQVTKHPVLAADSLTLYSAILYTFCFCDETSVSGQQRVDWKSIKIAGQKIIGETVYDLGHLQDAKYAFTIEATQKYPEVSFEVLVQYSSHCVSWGPKHGQIIDFSIHGEDRRIIDDKGIHRCFCEDRYGFSHALPDIFCTLPERHCLFTGRENWLTVDIGDRFGYSQEYEVYFNITRQSGRLLRIYVESAYVRTEGIAIQKPLHLKRRDRVRGKVLLAKKVRGEPVRRPIRKR